MNLFFQDFICKFFSFYFGSLGAMVLASVGIVDTSITFAFIVLALLFGYVATLNVYLAFVLPLIFGFSCIVMEIVLCNYRRRTYILSLYVLSMIALPLSKMILHVFHGDSPNLETPALFFLQMDDVTLFVLAFFLAAAACFFSVVYLNTSKRYLLTHWTSVDASALKDLQISLVFSCQRILKASWPLALVVGSCYFLSVLFGSFFTFRHSYADGSFDILPFWMLLVGLASKGRPLLLIIMVAIYTIIGYFLSDFFATSQLPIPSQVCFVAYGVMFFLFTWYSEKKKIRNSQ